MTGLGGRTIRIEKPKPMQKPVPAKQPRPIAVPNWPTKKPAEKPVKVGQ